MLFNCSFPSSFSARAEKIKQIGVIIHEVAQRVERSCQLSYFEDEDEADVNLRPYGQGPAHALFFLCPIYLDNEVDNHNDMH